MAKRVYWGSIEFAYNNKHSEFPRLKGGFVYAFYLTNDVRTFINAVTGNLSLMHMNIVKIEFVQLYDPEMEWDEEEVTE